MIDTVQFIIHQKENNISVTAAIVINETLNKYMYIYHTYIYVILR